MAKQHNKSILFTVILMSLVAVGIVLWTSLKTKSGVPPQESEAFVETEDLNKETKLEILAPNGKGQLSLISESDGENIIQSIYFSDLEKEESEDIKLLDKVSTTENYLIIPYNTFSPDNKYIYLREVNETSEEYIVLRTDGEEIVKGSVYITILDKFKDKYPELIVTEVTGWGGMQLLVVNSNKFDGTPVNSFWFDLSNLSFIQLSNRFN